MRPVSMILKSDDMMTHYSKVYFMPNEGSDESFTIVKDNDCKVTYYVSDE